MRKKNCSNQKAFTLAEAMMTILIFLIVIAGLYTSLLAGDRSWSEYRVKIEHQGEVRKAVEKIKYDLSSSGSSVITSVDVGGGASDEITFNIADDATTSGNVVWSSDTITYSLEGTDSNQLTRTEGTDVLLIAQNISALSFTRSVSDIVEVSISAQLPDDPADPNDQDKSIEKIVFTVDFDVQLRN